MPIKRYKTEDYYGINNARRPWADAKATEGSRKTNFRGCDTPEQRDFCLNCKKEGTKCRGSCPEMKAKGKTENPDILERRKKIAELRGQGLSYKEIAQALGCSKSVISNDLSALRRQGVYV